MKLRMTDSPYQAWQVLGAADCDTIRIDVFTNP
jgi:hypothetical protein